MKFRKNKRPTGLLIDKGSIRILMIGCFLIIAVMLSMCIVSIQIIRHAVVTKLKTSDMLNLAQSYGAVMEGKIDRAVDASLMLSYDPDVSAWIESNETDERAGQVVRSEMTDLAQQFGYETSFLTSNRTYHYWSYNNSHFVLLNTVSKDNASDAWFFNTIGIRKRYAINIDYNAELKNTYVWINALVGDVNQPIAITGLGMNLGGVIQTLIDQDKASKLSTNVWLVNNSGIVQLATNKADMNQKVSSLLPAAFSSHITKSASSTRFQIQEYTNANGLLYDVAYKQIRDTDWELVIQIPRTETTGFLVPVIWNILFSGLAILLIILLLFFLLSHKLANPYQRAIQLNQVLEQTVALRTKELRERNQIIQDGIDYARSIQQGIFPSENELSALFPEHFILFEPKEAVGGDFFWCKRTAAGRLLAVGDCTGHGVAGALLTTAVTAMLNQITDQIDDDPARILTEIQRKIQELAHNGCTDPLASSGLDIAVFFSSDAGTVRYAGAAMPAYIWDGKSLMTLSGNRSTIDSLARTRSSPFQNHSLEPADILTFYVATDGFKSQSGGAKQFPFGKKHWMELLTQIATQPMEVQKSALRQALLDYQGQEPRKDDVTVVCFKL